VRVEVDEGLFCGGRDVLVFWRRGAFEPDRLVVDVQVGVGTCTLTAPF
jgi:hypothetical protein